MCIILKQNIRIPDQICLNFNPNRQNDNKQAGMELMTWRWPGGKSISELIVVQLPDA